MKKTLISGCVLLAFTTVARAQFDSNNNKGNGPNFGPGFGYTTPKPKSFEVKPSFKFHGGYQQQRPTAPTYSPLDNYGARGDYNPSTGQYEPKTPEWWR